MYVCALIRRRLHGETEGHASQAILKSQICQPGGACIACTRALIQNICSSSLIIAAVCCCVQDDVDMLQKVCE